MSFRYQVLLVWCGCPQRDVEGTPLAAASFMGHVDVVKLLLAAGADVNQAMVSGDAVHVRL